MTIYALSTGSNKSGIAIIRVSGPHTKKVLLELLQGDVPEPKKVVLRNIYDPENNDIIDQALILWFPGPNSYTGEDLAEFHIHGSRAVIDKLLMSLSNIENCRLAEPGEFTKLAFENRKMNLLEVEALSDLVSSETELQRKQALKILSGNSSKKYLELRNALLKILSNIEAKIDFPEEDLPEDILTGIKQETNNIIKKINSILNDNKIGEKIRDGFKVVIVGPINAGKSSLLNYLSKREVAIVSSIPGTTRDILEVSLNLDGIPVLVKDTAGLRKTSDPIEKKGVELAISNAQNADLKIILFDVKSIDFKGFFADIYDKNSIIVLNKSDLVNNKLSNHEIKEFNPILISVKQEENLSALIKEIKKRLKDKFISDDNVMISRERHRINLEKCVSHLKIFLKNNSTNEFDKAAEDLRLATRYLGRVVGEVDVEEVLGKIFSDFCIGK